MVIPFFICIFLFNHQRCFLVSRGNFRYGFSYNDCLLRMRRAEYGDAFFFIVLFFVLLVSFFFCSVSSHVCVFFIFIFIYTASWFYQGKAKPRNFPVPLRGMLRFRLCKTHCRTVVHEPCFVQVSTFHRVFFVYLAARSL